MDLHRSVAARSGYVEVRDVFVNRLNVDLGLIVRYRLSANEPATTYLGAVELPAQPVEIERYEPQSPVAFSVMREGSVGLLPGNDALWIHAESFRDSLGFGLQDPNLCIAPGDSVCLTLRVLATPEPNAWSWMDRARASLGATFPIEGGFAFGTFEMSTWSDSVLRDWITVRGLRYISTPTPSSSRGHGLHGPALLQSPSSLESMRQFASAVHRAAPGVAVLAYFHSQLLNASAETQELAPSRVLSAVKLPLEYPRPEGSEKLHLFLPERGGQFAAELQQVLATFWRLGFDGIYWDEMAYSYKPWAYGGTWDGVSGDVDRSSHLLLRRKSAVPLIVQPWVEDRLREFTALRKVLVANTEPVTMTLHNYKFPRFVETSNGIAAKSAQLWTPIGLADRLRERASSDLAIRLHDHIENGLLYYYYSPFVETQHRTVTSFMFPITPRSIRGGTIYGDERILTTRSGRYGWNDDSRHEVHVFDARGREVSSGTRPVEQDGNTWTELVVPAGGTAAIVRHPSPE